MNNLFIFISILKLFMIILRFIEEIVLGSIMDGCIILDVAVTSANIY